jgi:hypothetical protein
MTLAVAKRRASTARMPKKSALGDFECRANDAPLRECACR